MPSQKRDRPGRAGHRIAGPQSIGPDAVRFIAPDGYEMRALTWALGRLILHRPISQRILADDVGGSVATARRFLHLWQGWISRNKTSLLAALGSERIEPTESPYAEKPNQGNSAQIRHTELPYAVGQNGENKAHINPFSPRPASDAAAPQFYRPKVLPFRTTVFSGGPAISQNESGEVENGE